MTPEPKKTLLPLIGAAAVIGLVVAVVLFGPRPEPKPPQNEPPAPQSAEKPKTESEPQTDENTEQDLGGWGSFTGGTDRILVRAEEAEEVIGNMQAGTAPDNEKVLDEAGKRASIQFVGAPDMSCGKDAEPAANAAVYKVEVDSAGTYYPWVRVWWKDSCGDSMFVVLQQGEDKDKRYVITDGTHEWWHWMQVPVAGGIELQKGTLTVRVENREDGARLGRILFTTGDFDSYVPSTPEG